MTPAAVLLLAAIFLRKHLTHVFVPLIIALLLAYIMDPGVRRMTKVFNVSRNAAIAFEFLLFIGVIMLLSFFVVPAIGRNLIDILGNADNLQKALDGLVKYVERVISGESFLGRYIIEKIDFLKNYGVAILGDKITGILDRLAGSAGVVVSYGADVLTGGVGAFYLLRDKEKILNYVFSFFPYEWRAFLQDSLRRVALIFTDYVRGQFVVAVLVGFIEAAGLYFIGVPYSALLGVIGGISNIVPYFGPFIGGIPAVIVALLNEPVSGIWTVLLFVLVQQFDNNYLSPKIIEGKLKIHPLATILVVFAGGELWGIIGVLLAVPIYACVRELFKRAFILLSVPRQDLHRSKFL